MVMSRVGLLCGALLAAVVLPAHADEVILNNGDHLSGTISTLVDGKLTIKTDLAGEIKIDLKNVRTFSTTHPVELHLQDGSVLKQTVHADEAGKIVTAGDNQLRPQPLSLTSLQTINPPPTQWNGSITASALMARGNTDTDAFTLAANAVRRTEQDRITFAAGYYFSKEKNKDTGDSSTTADNWFFLGKYDYFLTKKLYVLALTRVERDRIADLNLRVSPSVGVGYQWFDKDDFHFSTEAGLGWVFEDYKNVGSDDHPTARLAYHIDKKLNDQVMLFHNLEYLPSLDNISDFNINADAGVRANLTSRMFSEAKVEWRFDATPAPGSQKNDVRYILGVGWQF
jgi:putative salt-induced outer membrane protein YdiY